MSPQLHLPFLEALVLLLWRGGGRGWKHPILWNPGNMLRKACCVQRGIARQAPSGCCSSLDALPSLFLTRQHVVGTQGSSAPCSFSLPTSSLRSVQCTRSTWRTAGRRSDPTCCSTPSGGPGCPPTSRLVLLLCFCCNLKFQSHFSCVRNELKSDVPCFRFARTRCRTSASATLAPMWTASWSWARELQKHKKGRNATKRRSKSTLTTLREQGGGFKNELNMLGIIQHRCCS